MHILHLIIKNNNISGERHERFHNKQIHVSSDQFVNNGPNLITLFQVSEFFGFRNCG